MDAERASVSQTIVNGTLGAPPVFSALLLLCAALMGWCIGKMYDVADKLHETNQEIRILQIHVQDMNAILLREGIKKPGDEIYGPTGAKR